MEQRFNLQRFVEAQQPIMAQAMAELRSGRKATHWMWFVFPQIEGLGSSPMARHYAIVSLAEAEAYLRHDVLGPRLRTCTEIVNGITGRSITEILGQPDDMKFRSSVTLFSRATEQNELFLGALNRFFAGKPDNATIEILQSQHNRPAS